MTLESDRKIGQLWEKKFSEILNHYGKAYSFLQIGRTESAIAQQNGFSYTLPDVIMWNSPQSHYHEIKHKLKTKNHESYGLEKYRFDALMWLAQQSGQAIFYTIHDYDSKAKKHETKNLLSDWFTVNILELNERWSYVGNNSTSYVNGQKQYVPIYYWPSSYWYPLKDLLCN